MEYRTLGDTGLLVSQLASVLSRDRQRPQKGRLRLAVHPNHFPFSPSAPELTPTRFFSVAIPSWS